MYYQEKIIEGVWCYKTTPNGVWEPMGPIKLNEKIESLLAANAVLREENQKLEELLTNIKN